MKLLLPPPVYDLMCRELWPIEVAAATRNALVPPRVAHIDIVEPLLWGLPATLARQRAKFPSCDRRAAIALSSGILEQYLHKLALR